MLCFPLDNAEYEADALGAWLATRTRGVFAAEGHFNVVANGDMTVTVSPGIAWLKADDYWGVVIYEANPTVLTLSTADGELNRIDAVCLRLNKNQNQPELVIKKGAYAQSPSIAAPVRDVNFDEIYVATIPVNSGATAIGALDINDQRMNEAYCGLMRDGVTGISTQVIYNQWAAFMTTIQGILDENTAGNLLNLINSHAPVQLTVTLPASGWSTTGPYIQTATVTGMLDTDAPLVDVLLSAVAATAVAQLEAYGYIGRIDTGSGQITVTCYEDKPAVDLTLALKVVR
jgi:hypothetical protein